ncbi:MAG TPA: cytochrome c [Candidatus Dormibacteraeota bacterium]|nr:cytochrome c [Candidatus Dormibacteraeota bacterium]
MKNTLLLAAALALTISPSVFAAGNAEAGKTVYMKRCVACHAPDGNGKEAVAKMMKATIPPLPSKDVQALSDAAMRKVITDGKGKMKPVKNLSASDTENLIAFVRSLAKK